MKIWENYNIKSQIITKVTMKITNLIRETSRHDINKVKAKGFYLTLHLIYRISSNKRPRHLLNVETVWCCAY